MKITATWLDTRKEARNRPKERYEKTIDGHEGLMVRVHPSGSVSFVYRYTLPGTTDRHYLVLGKYGAGGILLADAFEDHLRAQRELEKGLDPAEERKKRQEAEQRAREERAGTGTVADLVEQFVHRKLRAERWDDDSQKWVRDEKNKTKARKRPDAAAALLGYVKRDGKRPKRRPRREKATLVSVHGKLNARDLTKRQLVVLLDDMVDRGAPIAANRTQALLKQLFDWAAAKDLVPASPMAGIERPGGEESPRERVLTADEVKAFWSNLEKPEVEMAAPTRLALKLLLVTAQRRGELTFAKWSHFDLDKKLWTISVELLKTSHARRSKPEPHVVPLSPLALELLQELKALTGEGIYVLPAHADKTKDRSYSEQVLSRAVRENEKHFEIAHFTPHDLRRTAASFMTKIGNPRLHVEKVLNHSTGDIAEVYDRHDYLPEKRAALERWGTHLAGIIAGKDSNVVPMPTPKTARA
jgi:integrase